jgi:hypothetical protein
MMQRKPNLEIGKLAKQVSAVLAVIAASTTCYAQNCALCYTQAASAGSRIIQGLRTGILILIVPPLFMSVGITWLAYRKRNQFKGSDSSDPSTEW